MAISDADLYNEEQKTIKLEIERKHGKTAEQLYAEREKRVRDATELREPDRVPVTCNAAPAVYAGIPRSSEYYDPLAWKRAVRQVTVDLEPDMCNAGLPTSGLALEALGVTNRLWPGGPLPEDYEYQFVEKEFMKEDEYDLFLADPTDFMIRCYLPRMYSALMPLSKLPPIGVIFAGFENVTTMFAAPEFEQLARTLSRAGREMANFRKAVGNAYKDLAYLGFPSYSRLGLGGIGGAPFDAVSSYLRGMKGSMLDMYRQPEKLLRACEMILDRRIAQAGPADAARRGSRIGMPLWRGDKSFMSDAQFRKFYWPGLKKALQTVIDLGYVPVPAFEAEFGDRLESLLELPKGKIIASIETVDIARARKILKGHTCLIVRGPFSLTLSSPEQIAQYYNGLFDSYGEGGGLVFNVRLPAQATTQQVKEMLAAIRKHCRY